MLGIAESTKELRSIYSGQFKPWLQNDFPDWPAGFKLVTPQSHCSQTQGLRFRGNRQGLLVDTKLGTVPLAWETACFPP
jgi:hypothetical protein